MKFTLCLRLIDRLLQSLSLLDGLGNLADAARDTLGTNLSKETCLSAPIRKGHRRRHNDQRRGVHRLANKSHTHWIDGAYCQKG